MNYDFDYDNNEQMEEKIFKEKVNEMSTKNKKIIKLVFGILSVVYLFVGVALLAVGIITDLVPLMIPGFVLFFCSVLMILLMIIITNAQDRIKNMSYKEYEDKYIKKSTIYRNDLYSSGTNSYYNAYQNTQIEVLKKRVENLEEELNKIKNERRY